MRCAGHDGIRSRGKGGACGHAATEWGVFAPKFQGDKRDFILSRTQHAAGIPVQKSERGKNGSDVEAYYNNSEVEV